jgi:hypothetical protein
MLIIGKSGSVSGVGCGCGHGGSMMIPCAETVAAFKLAIHKASKKKKMISANLDRGKSTITTSQSTLESSSTAGSLNAAPAV